MSSDKANKSKFAAAAEAALAHAWDGPVTLGDAEMLRERGRNQVLRCPVTDAPDGSPVSVILKASVGEGDEAFDPRSDALGGTAWRFRNEWAGTAFLAGVGTDPPLSARLYAADREAGLIVTEDLGAGECLADRMQATDRDRLEAGLFAYARSLGRLHAATVGREAEWQRLRTSFGGLETEREREGVRWLRENVIPFQAQCEALGVPLATGFDADVSQVQAAMDAPGPFLAFTPADTCPDNHRFVSESALCFFDFEFGGFRHALLDAAYLRAPFPTCWCVNRLPTELTPHLEATYRTELMTGCPEAGEDALFFPALVAANAYWAIASVSWDLEETLKKDDRWGLSTHRQRHPLRLANFADASDQFGVLPALAETARALGSKLNALWADGDPMPLYPSFRTAADSAG